MTGEQIDFQSKQIMPFKSMELTNKNFVSSCKLQPTQSSSTRWFILYSLHKNDEALLFHFVFVQI